MNKINKISKKHTSFTLGLRCKKIVIFLKAFQISVKNNVKVLKLQISKNNPEELWEL